MKKTKVQDVNDVVKQLMKDEQWVIVRIWTSDGNPDTPGQNVGHVSVQTKTKYMSLWPKQAQGPYGVSAKESEGIGLFKSITHEEVPTPAKDEQYEGRPAEKIFRFYSLDPDKMIKEYDRVIAHLKGWSLLAVAKDSESCVSLAARLLQAGGVDGLLSRIDEAKVATKGVLRGSTGVGSQTSKASGYALVSQHERAQEASTASKATSFYTVEMGIGLIIESPDRLASLLEQAKQYELQKYPFTKDLDEEARKAPAVSRQSRPGSGM